MFKEKNTMKHARSIATIAIAVLAVGTFCGTGHADLIWTSVEPYDSAPLNYYDGEPDTDSRPCEVWRMSIRDYDSSPGLFDFQILTNFGDYASRVAYGDTTYKDDYSYWKLSNLVAGDLYIKRMDKDTGTVSGIYGFVLEDRQGAADPWYNTLDAAGFGSYVEKSAGQLYLWDNVGASAFATGTYEEYADGTEIPLMPVARALPALIDLNPDPIGREGVAVDDQLNAYPTILMGGSLVNSGSVQWNTLGTWANAATNPLGTWTGQFLLPGFDSEHEVIEVWWTMGCGNDAVFVSTKTGGDPIPVPGALLLCGIGLGTIGLVSRIRSKRSRKEGAASRLLPFLVVALIAAGLGTADADINYGSVTGNTMTFIDITEGSTTDAVPLYGAPTLNGDTLLFNPIDFGSFSFNGSSDTTVGDLSLTVEALPGATIDRIRFEEYGDVALGGFGTSDTYATISANVSIHVEELFGGIPVSVDLAAAVVFAPSDGDWNLQDDGLLFGAVWDGSLFYDVTAALAAHGISGRATRISLAMDNTLHTGSEAGTSAYISKKQAGLGITPMSGGDPIPLPSSLLLVGVGVGSLWLRRRLKAQ